SGGRRRFGAVRQSRENAPGAQGWRPYRLTRTRAASVAAPNRPATSGDGRRTAPGGSLRHGRVGLPSELSPWPRPWRRVAPADRELVDDAAVDVQPLAVSLRDVVVDAEHAVVLVGEHALQLDPEGAARLGQVAAETGDDGLPPDDVAGERAAAGSAPGDVVPKSSVGAFRSPLSNAS